MAFKETLSDSVTLQLEFPLVELLQDLTDDLERAGLIPPGLDPAQREAEGMHLIFLAARVPRRFRPRVSWRDVPLRWRARRVLKRRRAQFRALLRPPQDPWMTSDETMIRLLSTI